MTLTLDLPPELEAKLTQEADKKSVPLPDYVRTVLEHAVGLAERLNVEPSAVHPLLTLSEKIIAMIPEEERNALPPDYAKNFDHYRHGAPKEE